MRIEEFRSMSSEIAALQELLQEIPEEDVIDRRSLLARIEQVKSQLPKLEEVEQRERAKAILTFRGKPVVGSHGIRADFGSKAANKFADAVAAIAASFDAPLKPTGPIPDRNDNQLLIIGTAVGSFGFQLEANAVAKLPAVASEKSEGKTNVELALSRAITLFTACVNRDDEALADNIDDLDKRALSKVRDFVTTLAENEATCALSFEKSKFQFQNTDVVRLTADRLSHNIANSDKNMDGAITGVISSRRTFEFTNTQGETIVGKIGPEITDPGSLKGLLEKQTTIRVSVTQVGGSKPRYVLKQVVEKTRELLG